MKLKFNGGWIGLASIVLLTLFVTQNGIAAGREIQKDYPLTQLTKNVYVIYGPNEEVSKQNQGFRNNPVVVITGKGVVVVDPGSSVYTGEMVVKKVKTVTDKPIIAVFDSHAHGDHWLGNQGIRNFYPNVPIYADAIMMQGVANGDGEMWIKAINQRSDGAIEGTKVVAPDHTVKDGDKLTFGNITIEVYSAGKAHSDSDIMLWIPEEKVFLFGDVLRNENLSPFMSSFKGDLAALALGEKINAKVYIPGHGKSGDKSIIGPYRNFIIDLKREVKKYFDQGLSDYEMKPKVINALNAYQAWSGFDENIGRLISLAYLDVENESF
jgi:glyoxylase-like metal-dependent hydrolase (beta-lactamase superfamily II)